MVEREVHIFKKLDKWLLLLYLAMAFLGLFTIYSASYNEEHAKIYDFSSAYGKQLFWIVASLIIGFVILYIDGVFLQNISYIIYGIVVLMLLVVLFMPAIKGAHSWFKLGGFSIQPSEFSKFATSLALAKYLSTQGVKIKDFSTKLTVLGILILPGFLILMQPDPGTLLVYFSFIFVMYREGLSGNVLLGGLIGAVVAIFAVFLKASNSSWWGIEGNYVFAALVLLVGGFILLIIKRFILPRYRKKKYRITIVSTVLVMGLVLTVNWAYTHVFKDRHRNRFEVTFGIKEDRKGVGYNSYQALSAIGSGSMFGKGYMKGTLSNDKYGHVPEQSTDFIFCSWAEERGFVGSTVLLILYFILLLKLIIIAERQRSKFARVFAYSTASILFFHFMINIAMVIGLAPVIGIPLPFFSKGGSAILGFSIMVFIVLRLDAERKEVLR